MQIFYNPRCGKCRNAKNFLEDQNISCDIFEYLSETFTEETLDEIVRKSGLDVTDFIRKKEDLYKEKFAQKSTRKNIFFIFLYNKLPKYFGQFIFDLLITDNHKEIRHQ